MRLCLSSSAVSISVPRMCVTLLSVQYVNLPIALDIIVRGGLGEVYHRLDSDFQLILGFDHFPNPMTFGTYLITFLLPSEKP